MSRAWLRSTNDALAEANARLIFSRMERLATSSSSFAGFRPESRFEARAPGAGSTRSVDCPRIAALQGRFHRSVAFKYFHPDDVISGEGTRLYGGRFAPAGVRAVYASFDEETAMREVTARKNALGGQQQIAIADYPRMTYVLSVATHRNLDLCSRLPPELRKAVSRCLRGSSHTDSRELAAIWIAQGIESVVFPFGCGRWEENVVVYLANAGSGLQHCRPQSGGDSDGRPGAR